MSNLKEALLHYLSLICKDQSTMIIFLTSWLSYFVSRNTFDPLNCFFIKCFIVINLIHSHESLHIQAYRCDHLWNLGCSQLPQEGNCCLLSFQSQTHGYLVTLHCLAANFWLTKYVDFTNYYSKIWASLTSFVVVFKTLG